MGERLCFRGPLWGGSNQGICSRLSRGRRQRGASPFAARLWEQGGRGRRGGGWCDLTVGRAHHPWTVSGQEGGSEFKGLKEEEGWMSVAQVRFIGMWVREGTSRPGGPRLRPVGLWRVGCLCVSSRAREEGSLQDAFKGLLPEGPRLWPPGSQVGPSWRGRGPAGPPAHSWAALGLRAQQRRPSLGGPGALLSPAPSARLSGPPRPCGCCGSAPQISL